MICRLCLTNCENYFELFGIEGLNENMAFIVGKHFWFEPKPDDVMYNFLCTNCWKIIKNFHELYTNVEKAHKNLSTNLVVIKTDPLRYSLGGASDKKYENSEDENNLVVIKTDPLESSVGVGGATEKIYENSDENNFEFGDNEFKNENLEDKDESPIIQKKKRGRPPSKAKGKSIKDSKGEIVLKNESKTTPAYDRLVLEDKMLTNFMKMICSICSEEQNSFSSLKRHFKSEHKQKGFIVCCNKIFFKRSPLVDHVEMHINPDSFKCSFCNKACVSRRTLKLHIDMMHTPQITPSESFPCSFCGKVFKLKKVMVRHQLIHVPEEDRKYKCVQCDKAYPSQGTLDQHIRYVHDRRYGGMCDICGKTFNNKEDVKKHRSEKHEGAERSKIKCRLCSEQFSTKYKYEIHKFEVHKKPNEKIEHRCEFCNKISANSQALRVHITKVHKRIARFQCKVCEKLFKTDLSLKEHMAAHTGVPLYICPHCPKTFTHNANMHHHRKRAHPKEFEEARIWKTETKQSWTKITAITN